MTLHATGKIVMQDAICEKCSEIIRFSEETGAVKCKHCGGLYKLNEDSIEGHEVERTYDFVSFQCVHSTYASKCNNECPAPGMYCEEHTSDDSFTSAELTIEYDKKRLKASEEVLKQMKESKRIWLIQEVSGINEQDGSIRKD